MELQYSAESDPLRALIFDMRAEKYSIIEFCREFERQYNQFAEREKLNDSRQIAYSKLFDKVAWYSPYPEERREYPNYLDEFAIKQAVDECINSLETEE